MARITLQNVSKSFGGDAGPWAVRDFSLDIDDGELVVFVGPSGCGKSTTLRMLAGLDEATSGTISIGGRDVTQLPPKDRNIAMVFQNYALYPHMSVYNNMAYGLRNRGMAEGEIKTRVEEAARILELGAMLDRKPRQLSGGQRQRVAMGRAIVRQPQVFLFDEPLSNLDAELRVHMRIEIARLHKELATTIIYVTHDQVEAMTMADRIAIIEKGKLQQVGPPQAVYDRPANLFVAGFVGSPPMNTLAGTLTFVAGQPVITTGHGAVQAASAGTGVEGTDVIVGIRSEHLSVGDGPAALHGVVENVEQLGHERHVVVRVGDALLVIRQGIGSDPIAAGDAVALVADPSGVHLFDPVSTERIN